MQGWSYKISRSLESSLVQLCRRLMGPGKSSALPRIDWMVRVAEISETNNLDLGEFKVPECSLLVAEGRAPLQRKFVVALSAWPLPEKDEHFLVGGFISDHLISISLHDS